MCLASTKCVGDYHIKSRDALALADTESLSIFIANKLCLCDKETYKIEKM